MADGQADAHRARCLSTLVDRCCLLMNVKYERKLPSTGTKYDVKLCNPGVVRLNTC